MKRLAPVLAVLTLATSVTALGLRSMASRDASCPPGYESKELAELRAEFAPGATSEAEVEEQAERAEEAGEGEASICLYVGKHPEPFFEISARASQMASMVTAPLGVVPRGAYRAALRQRQAIIAASPAVPRAGGTWRPYGVGPLIANDPRYPSINGAGFVELAGRVDSLDYDPVAGRLFAAIGTGGVWMSQNLGETWVSISERLPTQIIGAVGWVPGGGGTVVAASGEPLQGGNTYTGTGAYWTSDLGATWQRATGVPDGAMGFQVTADPTNPNEVYVATSKGLFRSTDAGRSFVNVRLPTGVCVGNTGNGRCLLANFVTDVVVQAPDDFGNAGGEVVAAVGYRAGARPFPQDPKTPEAPWNGLYKSPTGAPGTFEKLTAPGFAPQARIGRVELGATVGEEQNHDYLYAIVQDAVRFNGAGAPAIDAPENQPVPFPLANTSINGIYVSDDFGETWTQMANEVQIAENPASGSGLTAISALQGPGIQAWYNEWVKPDPTRQTGEGVPTRLLFGLEEVWQNRFTNVPQDGPSDFRVIGRYYSTDTCIISVQGVPTCPAGNPLTPTTTHPDQHDAIFVPDGEGGVTVVVGGDGGTYTQHAASGEEFTNTDWGEGANDGYNTLLPYFVTVAKDGTAWMGLQDNGTAKISPQDGFRQYMTFGADGAFTAVHPDNSRIAYSESQNAGMRVTTNGGTTWTNINPAVTQPQFANPFMMDPTDPNHLITAGREVKERLTGPTGSWIQVFDLGTNRRTGQTNRMSALDLQGDAAYVGFCGACDIINGLPFQNGLATNVGGNGPPARGTPSGWHFVQAKGLPNRYITSIDIDPNDVETIYVTLGGYANRQWRPPGSYGDRNTNIGSGHVFKSTDGGRTFTRLDAGGALPNAPAFWVTLHRGQLVVGTQVGVFLSSDTNGTAWAALDRGLPIVPIANIDPHPGNPNVLFAATYGRGIYRYQVPKT